MTDPGNGIGSNVPRGYYTRSQASKLVKRSPDTLKRWHKQGLAEPSSSMYSGKLRVCLYSNADIDHMIEVSKKQKPGRKPKGGKNV